MRPLEAVLAASLAAGSAFVLAGEMRKAGAAGALIALAILAHIFIEGPRLQAAPFYVALGLLAAAALFPVPLFGRFAVGLSIGALSAAGACACYVYPVFALPRPSGPYAVGSTVYYLTDESRVEKFGDRAGKKRAIVAQVWYPASSCAGYSRVPYRDAATLTWKSAHLKYVRTNACADAPMTGASGRAPVILFSPSSGGYRSQNTFMAEEFASHGYIFAGFDHSNTSSRILWKDGSLIHSLPDVWLNLNSLADLKRSTIKTEAILADNVRDMQYFLDQLSAGANARIQTIAEHVDLTRIAAVGHSFGGGAAAELCRVDRRVRTGLNMDGWMFSGVNAHGVGKPFFFMIEDDPLWPGAGRKIWSDTPQDIASMGDDRFYASIRQSLALSGGCVARLRGSGHGNFADMALYIRPWPWRKPARSAEEIHRRVNSLAKAFLASELDGNAQALQSLMEASDPDVDLRCEKGANPERPSGF